MIFVDTNVLVYSAVNGAPFRTQALTALAQHERDRPQCVSRQILREYLAVVTRPQIWGRPLTLAEAAKDTDTFSQRFTILEDGPSVWSELTVLSQQIVFAGRQVHDANIVATMLAYGAKRLLTFNQGDFRRFAGVIDLVLLPQP